MLYCNTCNMRGVTWFHVTKKKAQFVTADSVTNILLQLPLIRAVYNKSVTNHLLQNQKRALIGTWYIYIYKVLGGGPRAPHLRPCRSKKIDVLFLKWIFHYLRFIYDLLRFVFVILRMCIIFSKLFVLMWLFPNDFFVAAADNCFFI